MKCAPTRPAFAANSCRTRSIVATAAAGSIRFGLSDAVDPATAAWLFGGAGAGALLGARLAGRLSEIWLARAFVTVALVAAVRLAVTG